MTTKKELAIKLSQLKQFRNIKEDLEQYVTPSEIAATLLWNAYMLGDIEGKKVIDLGAGTGILGIGALLLNAKEVIFIEVDKEALKVLKRNISNIKTKKYKILLKDVISEEIEEKADTIIMNPPFGTKKRHADLYFLERAASIGKVIYSIHKANTVDFIEKKFHITHKWKERILLKNTLKHHTKEKHYVDSVIVRIKLQG